MPFSSSAAHIQLFSSSIFLHRTPKTKAPSASDIRTRAENPRNEKLASRIPPPPQPETGQALGGEETPPVQAEQKQSS